MSSVVTEIISRLGSAWEVQQVVPSWEREGADWNKSSLEQGIEINCMLDPRISYLFKWEEFKCIYKRKYKEIGREDRAPDPVQSLRRQLGWHFISVQQKNNIINIIILGLQWNLNRLESQLCAFEIKMCLEEMTVMTSFLLVYLDTRK